MTDADRMDIAMRRLATTLGQIGVGVSLAGLVKQIAQTRGEFQQLEVAFATLLQSKEKADALMSQMVELAAKTPFDLQGVASGARQLLAYGFAAEDITNTLTRLGNVAAGLGLNLQDLTWLYGTTAVQGRLYTRDVMQFQSRGIDLAGESKGVFFDKALVTDTDKWGTASLTSGSFGQTFKITPLQLVRAISSVVNGGQLMEPYIVSEILDADGNTVMKAEPTVVRRTISKETSDTMRTLIESVVTEGTAKNAKVAGFSIGGKTGTSEKIDVFDENGQRVQDKIVSFVGIAPMDDPEYIILAALDTPSRTTGIYISGGVMAAPTVGAVMADVLPYLGVKQSFSEDDIAGKQIVMEDLTGMTAKDAQTLLKKEGLTAAISGSGETVTGQIPSPGQTVPGGSQVLLFLGQTPEPETVKVPDFYGMNRQQASDAAGALGLYILVTGNDEISTGVTVTAQNVAKDTEVPAGTTITLVFADTAARD